MKYKKILFPTDFSDASENALKYADKLAEELGASLDLISIFRVPAGLSESMGPEMIDQIIKDKKELTEKKMLYLTRDHRPNRETQQEAIFGIFVAEEIAEYARTGQYDLIVMGTKGEEGLYKKIMGGVTTETMLKASCPVLAIPSDAVYQGINSVAFATDYEKNDGGAVQFTKEFTQQIGAEMHVVHVEKKELFPDEKGEMTDFSVGFSDFTVIQHESVEEGLEAYIEEREVDVLALFIPQRRLWERLFHSSFTKKMTFHSKIPLLVFRGMR